MKKPSELADRAAVLMDRIEDAQEAAKEAEAELQAIMRALREALARKEGKVMELFQHRHGWRTFLITNGVLRPIVLPVKIHASALDEPTAEEAEDEGEEKHRPAAALLEAVPA